MENEPVTQKELPPDIDGEGKGLTWKMILAIVAVGLAALAATFFLRQPGETTTTSTSPVASLPTQPDSTTTNEPALGSAEDYFRQGNDFVQSGQLQQAVTAYQKAIELDPDYQAVYANLGVVYYQLEELDLAAQQYQRALEIDPDDGEVIYNLGALNLQRALISGGAPDTTLLEEAITLIEQSLELSPDLAEPHFTLGVAYFMLNQKEEAIKAFEEFQAKDTGKDPRASQEAQRYLDELRAE